MLEGVHTVFLPAEELFNPVKIRQLNYLIFLNKLLLIFIVLHIL